MKKFLIPIVVLLAIVCLGVTACPGIGYVGGTGPVINQTYDFADFKNIEISNAFGFNITRSDSYNVTIEAHENLISHMDIKLNGDTLIVRMKTGSYTNSETRANISLPELSSLTISGACRGSVEGFKSSNILYIALSGASQLDLNLEAGRTRIDISGASKVRGALIAQDARLSLSGASQCEIDGSSPIGDIEVSGASKFTGPSFKMQDCSVNASGASTARLFASGTLNIEASGASTVKYSGEPRIKGLDVSGTSHIESE